VIYKVVTRRGGCIGGIGVVPVKYVSDYLKVRDLDSAETPGSRRVFRATDTLLAQGETAFPIPSKCTVVFCQAFKNERKLVGWCAGLSYRI
jgi:hypothetical protein